MNTQLLCTFSSQLEYEDTFDIILEHYDIAFDKVFVLQNTHDEDELFITYNIIPDPSQIALNKTISIHRKKHTNTLYTINALNKLVKKLNGGKVDHSFPVPWNDFQNSILTTDGEDLKIIPTKLFKIYNLG